MSRQTGMEGVTRLLLLPMLILLMSQSVISPTSAAVTYPLGFFNITLSATENVDVGFVHVFVCTNDKPTNVSLLLQQSAYNEYKVVTKTNPMNASIDFSIVSGPKLQGSTEYPFGLRVVSDYQVDVHGFKSDHGSTDGYFVPVLTENSTEFWVAGYAGPRDTGLLIASAYPDTCIEVYQTNHNGTLERVLDIFLPDDLMISQIIFTDDRDTTGMFVNSSRPITLFADVACGFVPVNVSFCDYLADHIPPVSELGVIHVVPPIRGRHILAGYLVRVVATVNATMVMWTAVSPVSPASPITLDQGRFVQIDVKRTNVPLLITCSQPCVVMQYNKGRQAVQSLSPPSSESVRTDPFMMLTVPVSHYVKAACFLTPNAVDRDLSTQPFVRVSYLNSLSITTLTTNTAAIRFNGGTVAGWSPIGMYSVTSFAVSHGSHSVTVTTATATFAAYLYGHSNSSINGYAYGYPVAYKMDGTPAEPYVRVNETTVEAPAVNASLCNTQPIYTGSSVFASSTDLDDILQHGFKITANTNPSITLTDTCVSSYTAALKSLSDAVFRDINNKICKRELCSYLNSPLGSPYVAIDARTLVDISGIGTSVSMMTETISYGSLLDVEVQAYTACREEICQYISRFDIWREIAGATSLPEGQLLPTPTGCATLTFSSGNFTTSQRDCDFEF